MTLIQAYCLMIYGSTNWLLKHVGLFYKDCQKLCFGCNQVTGVQTAIWYRQEILAFLLLLCWSTKTLIWHTVAVHIHPKHSHIGSFTYRKLTYKQPVGKLFLCRYDSVFCVSLRNLQLWVRVKLYKIVINWVLKAHTSTSKKDIHKIQLNTI